MEYFQSQYLPLLVSLDLSFNTNLTVFTGNVLPKLKQLDLFLTSLSRFECGSMRSLAILDLSTTFSNAGYNKLTDDVVDQLARCDFLNIGQIVLSKLFHYASWKPICKSHGCQVPFAAVVRQRCNLHMTLISYYLSLVNLGSQTIH